MDSAKLHHLALNEVDKSSRSCYYDLYSGTHGANLALNARTAIHREHLHSVDIFRIVGKVAADLQTKFACWCYDKCLWRKQLHIDALKHRQAECRSLSRTRLGESHHIIIFV